MSLTNPRTKVDSLLSEFAALGGSLLPAFEPVDAEDIPEPYRILLAHRNDMTPTLEEFHGTTVSLDVLKVRRHQEKLMREVLLVCDDTTEPVELGVIKINLDLFPPEPREKIVACHLPLGTILKKYNIEHKSRPTAFLRLRTNERLNEILRLDSPQVLYGRCNTIFNGSSRPLAEVIEVLPPINQNKTEMENEHE